MEGMGREHDAQEGTLPPETELRYCHQLSDNLGRPQKVPQINSSGSPTKVAQTKYRPMRWFNRFDDIC